MSSKKKNITQQNAPQSPSEAGTAADQYSYAMYLRKSRSDDPALSVEAVVRRHKALLWEIVDKQSISRSRVEVYEEVVSGESILARPKMLELLPKVEAGRYRGVFVADMQRLGRGDMMEQGMILNAFRNSGTRIITPTKTYDLSEESDDTLASFEAFFSRMEYNTIKKRLRRGLMATVQEGGYIANPPYGYRKALCGRLPSLEIVEEEAKFIRHIYKRYLEGVGAATISYELNAMGSVPRRSAHWDRSGVRVVLRNPTYMGKVAWNRVRHERKPGEKQRVTYMPESEWIMVDGKHPAIISEADWYRVQEIRKQKFIPSAKTGEVKNPLAGLVYCGVCGYHMQRQNAHKGTDYLLCGTKGCVASAKMEYVQSMLLDTMRERLDRLLSEAQAPAQDVSAEKEALTLLEKEIARLSARIPRLMEFLEDGTYTRTEYRARRDEIETRLKQLELRRGALQEQIKKKSGADLAAAAKKLQDVLRIYPTSDEATKNRLLKSVLLRIDYYKGKKTKPQDFQLIITARDFAW